MTGTETAGSGGVLLCQAITQKAAAAQNEALDQVLKHLTIAGINARLIKRRADRCSITLYSTGENLWHPPEMTIYADAGWKVATISIGERSGSYLVEPPVVGPDDRPSGKRIEVVLAAMPDRVACLVQDDAGVST